MASVQGNLSRPSLALGFYPERDKSQVDRLDALLQRGMARVITEWELRTFARKSLIKRIDHAGQLYSELPDAAFSQTVLGLREKLFLSGWDSTLAIQAFAAVREMSDRVLGMRHYDAQLKAGWVMYNGQLAEMQTGEGKTLAATLPASAAAFSGVPVHIVTANDYLAMRDAELMRPLYEALGLTVGVVNEKMDFNARQAAYACDITYGTNKQICFDYLRDRVERGLSRSQLHLTVKNLYDDGECASKLMLRGLCFAIVDEADSVLIDDAYTPLILSKIKTLNNVSRATYQQALNVAGQLLIEEDYSVQAQERIVKITPKGIARVAKCTDQLGSVRHGKKQCEELVHQALCAQHLYVRDRDYIVCDNKVQIVDVNTGRILPDQSWARGIQQLVEAKEHCDISPEKETLARISYQQFFCRYLKLSGMSGTAREIKSEVSRTYGLEVVCIPPHRRCRRVAMPEQIFLLRKHAQDAVIASAREEASRGRAVLIGTRTVQASEVIAKQLFDEGLHPQVLNARQDKDEARVVEQAGTSGRITVATNMAGRGTDILPDHGVLGKGGLHVILSERNDASRIDRQLFGRCARQGNPGSYQSFVSLEDEIAVRGISAWSRRVLTLFARDYTFRLPHWIGSRALNYAQRRVQRQHERTRLLVEREDKRLNNVLSFAGESE